MIKEYIKRNRLYIRVAAIVLGALFLVGMLGVIGVYLKRESLLKQALQQMKQQALEEYQVDLQIDQASFSGFSKVSFQGIKATPRGRDQLLGVDYMGVDVKWWPLLSGKVKLSALDIRHARLSLVKKDSLSNYDFLFRPKKIDTTARQLKVSLAELANKLVNRVLYKVPDNLYLEDFEASYRDDSTRQKLSVPKAEMEGGELHTVILLNDKEARWQVRGVLHPDKNRLHVEVFGDGKAVQVPVIKQKYGLTLQFDTLETDLHQVKMQGEELLVSGGWAVKNLILQHWRISEEPIVIAQAHLKATVRVGNHSIALDPETEIQMKKLVAHPFAKISFKPHKTIELGVDMPEIAGQDLFDSFPQGMFSNLEGIRVGGKLAYHADLFVDLDNPDSVHLKADMEKKGFRINSWGKTNLSKINSPFVYTPYEDGKPMRSIFVGPSNPNFTPLNQISSHLKHALLTAEDPSFFSHRGFVEEAFEGAITANLKAKAFRRGGSTISMQLVKNVFLGREKTLSRKIEEILMVWLIENNRVVSKERMFEVYLNIIEWGRNVYGIGEAARFYFGKHPSELTVGESIYLASIVPKPKTGLYPFQYDGSLKPYLGGYFRLIGGIMARRGLIDPDSNSYGFYEVRLREALRPAGPDTLQVDTVKTDPLEKELEEAKGFLERLFGGDKKQNKD